MPLRDMNREQMWLLPPTLDELVPQDYPARFVAEFVNNPVLKILNNDTCRASGGQ